MAVYTAIDLVLIIVAIFTFTFQIGPMPINTFHTARIRFMNMSQ